MRKEQKHVVYIPGYILQVFLNDKGYTWKLKETETYPK